MGLFHAFDYAFLRCYTLWAIHCSVRYTTSSLLGVVTSTILLLWVSQCLFVTTQVSTCILSSVPLCILLVHSLCVPSISRAFRYKLFQAFLQTRTPCVPRGYLVGTMHSCGSCAFTPGTLRVFLIFTPCVPCEFPLYSQCIILHCGFPNVSFCPILRAFNLRIAQFMLFPMCFPFVPRAFPLIFVHVFLYFDMNSLMVLWVLPAIVLVPSLFLSFLFIPHAFPSVFYIFGFIFS